MKQLAARGVEILGPVEGLEQANILGPCILGHPTSSGEHRPLVLGPGVTIRAYAVLYQGSTLGAGAHIAHGAMVRENNVIGAESSIGSGTQLGPNNRIGERTKVHSLCFLESVTMGDDIFCGPHVMFTDDLHPPCPSYLQCVGGATVGDRASIGANSTIMPGINIGARALVGAGSVVHRHVGEGEAVIGSPLRSIGPRNQLSCKVGIYEHAYQWETDDSVGITLVSTPVSTPAKTS